MGKDEQLENKSVPTSTAPPPAVYSHFTLTGPCGFKRLPLICRHIFPSCVRPLRGNRELDVEKARDWPLAAKGVPVPGVLSIVLDEHILVELDHLGLPCGAPSSIPPFCEMNSPELCFGGHRA